MWGKKFAVQHGAVLTLDGLCFMLDMLTVLQVHLFCCMVSEIFKDSFCESFVGVCLSRGEENYGYIIVGCCLLD